MSKVKYLLVGLAGILGLAAMILEDSERAKQDKQHDTTVATLTTQIRDTKTTYNRLILKIATNSPQNQALISALTADTNFFELTAPPIGNPTQSVSVLQQKRALLTLNKAKKRNEAIPAEKEFLKPYVLLWNYTMDNFISRLSQTAQGIGAHILKPSYQGLPDICQLQPNLKTPVLTFTSDTNIVWRCECYIIRADDMIGTEGPHQPRLQIDTHGTNGNAFLIVSKSAVSMQLPGFDYKQIAISNNSERVIDDALKDMMASIAEQLGVTPP
jgi:hypothetical protein